MGRVPLYGTNLPRQEPDQSCEQCGARGTVGRAVRFNDDGSILELHRFCATCWPENYARFQARWREEDRLASEEFCRNTRSGSFTAPSTAFEGATWHVPLDMLREVRLAMLPEPAPEELAGLAKMLQELEAQIPGPVPLEVQAFIIAYGK